MKAEMKAMKTQNPEAADLVDGMTPLVGSI